MRKQLNARSSLKHVYCPQCPAGALLYVTLSYVALLADASPTTNVATAPIVLRGHDGLVAALVYVPDTQYLVSASWDKSVRSWDLRDGKETGQFSGHTANVVSLAVSGNGRLLATGSQDHTARLWDVVGHKELHRFDGFRHGTDVAISPDGRTLAVAHYACIHLFDTGTFTETRSIAVAHTFFNSLRFSGDGRHLIAATPNTGASAWDALSGEQIYTLAVPGEQDWAGRQFKPKTWSAAFSPDGKLVAVASQDGVRVFDVESHKLAFALNTLTLGHDFAGTPGVCHVEFSRDGQRMLAAGGRNTLWVFQTSDWTVIQKFHGKADGYEHPDNYFTTAVFCSDGRRVAAASTDTVIRVWTVP